MAPSASARPPTQTVQRVPILSSKLPREISAGDGSRGPSEAIGRDGGAPPPSAAAAARVVSASWRSLVSASSGATDGAAESDGAACEIVSYAVTSGTGDGGKSAAAVSATTVAAGTVDGAAAVS